MTTWTPPSKAEVEAAVQEMVRRLAERFRPEKIYLIGSHARGDAGPDSDIDLLVVVKTGSPWGSAVEMRMAVDDILMPKDILVVMPQEFESHRDIVGTLPYVAVHEGRLLHDRSL